ncbi:MAG: hypothetical protein ACFFG0_12380 [Candidatus Thorarchaeota archaeon]
MEIVLNDLKSGENVKLIYKNLIILGKIRDIKNFNFKNINGYIPESEITGKILYVDKNICIITNGKITPENEINDIKVIPICLIIKTKKID